MIGLSATGATMRSLPRMSSLSFCNGCSFDGSFAVMAQAQKNARSRSLYGLLVLPHPARFDRGRPFLDLASDKGLQIGGGTALRRDDDQAERMKALTEGRIVHHRNQRLVEPLNQRRRRALRQEHRVPGIGVESGEALLVRGGEIRQDRRALARERGD